MLVWWVKGNSVPPLVTESPNGTQRPSAGVLGQPTTSIVFGDTGIDDNYRLGLRLTVGYWLDDCQINGLEATWFSLGDGANSGNFYDAASGDARSRIVARPFFNAVLGQQDSQLVAYPGIVGGDVQTQTASELHSLALLLRHNLDQNCGRRIDLVGGYRYLRFRESLNISENLVSLDTGGVVPVGTTFDVQDLFDTENDFHGGEVGLSTVWTRGCWDFDVLAKLALGNMHQQVTVDGRTVIAAPSQVPVVGQGGLLALPTNMGTYSWNEFAMIPELNMNVRYRLSECLSLQLGYSLLWVTEVARTGDQIDLGRESQSVAHQRRQPGWSGGPCPTDRFHRHVGARRQLRCGLGLLTALTTLAGLHRRRRPRESCDSSAASIRHAANRGGSHGCPSGATCQRSGTTIPRAFISIRMSSQVACLAAGFRSRYAG